MTWTIIWSIFLGVLTLILVGLAISKTDRPFEAAAVIMAMIAYHRLGWHISAGQNRSSAVAMRHRREVIL
jgi:hypothetical protein